MTTKKPILPNSHSIEGQTVARRVEKVFFTEVYELSDKTFLYLFTNLERANVIESKQKYVLIDVRTDDRSYLGLITDKHSHEHLTTIIEDLTVAKGFALVAGMEKLKQTLIDDVINPLLHPEKFAKFKVSIPNGILLYGPPGCGKTFIVRKLAEELGYTFYEIKHSDIASPYVHGTVEKIAEVFDKAKKHAPAIVFIDEISGLAPSREYTSGYKEEEVNQLLLELNDAADNEILVVGATNYPDRIDKAILRTGRMDKKIKVPPPDFEARKELFEIGLRGRPHKDDINFDNLAALTDGYSSSDIVEGIVENVARKAANLGRKAIDEKLLVNEIKKFKPIPEKEKQLGFRVSDE